MIKLKFDKEKRSPKQLFAIFKKHINSILPYFIEINGNVKLMEDSSRSYSPMDRVQAPNCPFTEYFSFQASPNDNFVSCSVSRAMWNESTLSNQSFTFMIKNKENEVICYMSSYSSKQYLDELTIKSDLKANSQLERLASFLEVAFNFPK